MGHGTYTGNLIENGYIIGGEMPGRFLVEAGCIYGPSKEVPRLRV